MISFPEWRSMFCISSIGESDMEYSKFDACALYGKCIYNFYFHFWGTHSLVLSSWPILKPQSLLKLS